VLGALPDGASLRGWRPDVVHVQFAVAAYGARLRDLFKALPALRATGAPVVMTLHEVSRDTASLRSAGRALYRRLLRHADRVVVHTEPALGALREVDGGAAARAAIVPLPRSEPPAAHTTAEEVRERHGLGDVPVLLAFGFVHVDKGLDDLVRAFAATRARRAGARLVVAGDVRPRSGAFRAFEARDRLHLRRVRRLVRRAGLGDRVLFTGYVPSGDVRPWFDVATAAVLPYRRIEESAVAGLAASAGTPLVVTDVGDLARQAARPDLVVAPRDPAALATALDRAVEQPVAVAPADDAADVVAATTGVYEALVREEVQGVVPALA
jgi:glycosyltransferase involved in cell wall biosynthesis